MEIFPWIPGTQIGAHLFLITTKQLSSNYDIYVSINWVKCPIEAKRYRGQSCVYPYLDVLVIGLSENNKHLIVFRTQYKFTNLQSSVLSLLPKLFKKHSIVFRDWLLFGILAISEKPSREDFWGIQILLCNYSDGYVIQLTLYTLLCNDRYGYMMNLACIPCCAITVTET